MTIKEARERYEKTVEDIGAEKAIRLQLLRQVAKKAANELLPFQYEYKLGSGLPHVGIELGTDKNWYVKYTHGVRSLEPASDTDWDNFGKAFQAFLSAYGCARMDEVVRLQEENAELEKMLAE